MFPKNKKGKKHYIEDSTKNSRKKFIRNTNRESQNLVVNLSCHHISFWQNCLLNKGMSFVPTPRNFDFLALIEESCNKFINRMSVKYFSREKSCKNNPLSRKSGWIAPRSQKG